MLKKIIGSPHTGGILYWKRNLARWRRNVGFFSEKRERVITNHHTLPSHSTISFKVKCTPKRNYILSLQTEKPSNLLIEVKTLTSTENLSFNRNHHLHLYSKDQTILEISITNNETKENRINFLKIRMEGDMGPLQQLYTQGKLYDLLDIYNKNPQPSPPPLIIRARGFIDLLENGITSDNQSTTSIASPTAPYLYLLYSAISFNTSGYASRSHSIAKRFNATVYTRLGYPKIVARHIDKNKDLLHSPPEKIQVDNVDYHILDDPSLNFSSLPIKKYIELNSDKLFEKLKKSPPKAVIAASNYLNGYVGYRTAQKLKVPFAYEMRGLWHITGLTKNPDSQNSDLYKLAEKSEIDLAVKADKVFVLSQAMKQWLTEKGVEQEKINLAPNGVNLKLFYPAKKPQHLLDQFQSHNKHIFGFIGSLTEYEGVDLLIKAFKQLYSDNSSLSLIIVGNGLHFEHLKAEAKDCPAIHFTGRVPHDEVLQYYHLCDTMVYARTNNLVCQLVPPLKPLEAMATEKLVICSNVPPMLDYLDAENNGIAFQTDCLESLIEAMTSAINPSEQILQMPKNARNFIKQHHQWEQVVKTLSFLD